MNLCLHYDLVTADTDREAHDLFKLSVSSRQFEQNDQKASPLLTCHPHSPFPSGKERAGAEGLFSS